MNTLRSFGMVLMLSLVVVSHVAVGRDSTLAIKGDYPVEQVAHRVYVIRGPIALLNKANQGFRSNPGFVVTSRGVVVIDPGISVHVGRMVLEKIRSVTDGPLIDVFNSHIHGDHWLANGAIKSAFPDAVIYAHTDNENMVEVVEQKVLFLGDVAGGRALSRMVDGSFSGNIAAIDQAMQTGAAYFVPGHGPGGGREVPQVFQVYLKTLYTTVQDLYEQDLSDFEVKPKVAEALAAYRDWFGFDEFLGPHVSQAYLEVEARAF